ncbi:MAG: hypothetical protein WC826_05210 [Microgenomates group bacterium]|jgi:hypothetical protein
MRKEVIKMGGGEWTTDVFSEREKARVASGKKVFDYDDYTKRYSRDKWKAHPNLDPKGIRFRESRDSAEHAYSLAIATLFDVTGSMRTLPQIFQKKLGELNGLVVRKGWAEHPQFLFGAIGDATCDSVPLQIGQFESDNRMDENLEKILLEGGGGAQKTESYELATYFMARHTDIDCWNIRRHKGYLFIIGDEMVYPNVKAREVADVIGDTLQENISTVEIFEEVKKRYETFYILPTAASNGRDPEVLASWRKLLGQNVLQLEDPEAVCETIALQIGLSEGTTDLDAGSKNLAEFGVSKSTILAVRNAVVPVHGRLVKGDSGTNLGPIDTDKPKYRLL